MFVIIAGFPENSFTCVSGAPSSSTPGNFATGGRKLIMKRTYQASKVRRARTHGFLVRMKTRGGRAVINARRAKGRKRLAV
jgi:large subunit ribosomal protein L34